MNKVFIILMLSIFTLQAYALDNNDQAVIAQANKFLKTRPIHAYNGSGQDLVAAWEEISGIDTLIHLHEQGLLEQVHVLPAVIYDRLSAMDKLTALEMQYMQKGGKANMENDADGLRTMIILFSHVAREHMQSPKSDAMDYLFVKNYVLSQGRDLAIKLRGKPYPECGFGNDQICKEAWEN